MKLVKFSVVAILAVLAISAINAKQGGSSDYAYATVAYTDDGQVKGMLLRDGKRAPTCNSTATGGDGPMCMITVETNLLSKDDLAKLDQVTIPTAIGKEFRYYGRPDIWGRILPYPKAQELAAQLQELKIPFNNSMVLKLRTPKGGG